MTTADLTPKTRGTLTETYDGTGFHVADGEFGHCGLIVVREGRAIAYGVNERLRTFSDIPHRFDTVEDAREWILAA